MRRLVISIRYVGVVSVLTSFQSSDIARQVSVIPVSSAECDIRHSSALSAYQHITSAQRNNMHAKTVDVMCLVLQGYKNRVTK